MLSQCIYRRFNKVVTNSGHNHSDAKFAKNSRLISTAVIAMKLAKLSWGCALGVARQTVGVVLH